MATYRFGLEQEFFISRNGRDIIEIPKGSKLPYDECGYLAEARGLPADNILLAVFNLQAEVYRMKEIAVKEKLILLREDYRIVPKDVKDRIHRRFEKGTVKYENFYGFEHHRNKQNEGTAGIHLSVTKQEEYKLVDYPYKGETGKSPINVIWDYAKFFMYLDRIFKQYIKDAKRNPGFYEFKTTGRVEYRSLPTTTNYEFIIRVVEEYFKDN